MTKGGEVLKNNYTVSSRKKISVLYSDDIKSALYHSIAVFWTE